MLAYSTPLPLPAPRDELSLTPFRRADLVNLLVVASDPEMTRWLALSEPLRDEVAALAWIEQCEALRMSGVGLRLAVRENDQLVGCVELRLTEDGSGLVGYWTAPWARGRGIASAAVRLLCEHALSADLVWKLQLLILPGNAASAHVAARNNFSFVEHVWSFDPRVGADVEFELWSQDKER